MNTPFHSPTPLSPYTGRVGSTVASTPNIYSQQTPTRGVSASAASLGGNNPSLMSPRYQEMPPPGQPRRPISSFGSFSFEDIDRDSGNRGPSDTPVVNTTYIDAVAQSMGFETTDEDYRSSLHSIPLIAPDLTKGQVQLAIYQTGLMYAILKECRAISQTCHKDHTLMTDIYIRLEDTFELTQEQKLNIRLVAGDMLLDPSRVCYTQLHMDVEARIKERQKELRFFNIFDNLARQRILATVIRRTCSSVRNAYREMLRDSVIGSNFSTLEEFVITVSNRFTSRAPLNHLFVVHVALLRRFALEQPQTLSRVAEDDEQDDEQALAGGPSRSSSTQSDSFMENENDSRGSSAASSVSQPDRGRKRKRGLLPIKAVDFWSMVEMWFTARMKPDQLGPSLSTPGWTQYIEQTLEQDRIKFKRAANINPFLTDFAAEAGGAGASGNCERVEETPAAGAIGSMRGILGAL